MYMYIYVHLSNSSVGSSNKIGWIWLISIPRERFAATPEKKTFFYECDKSYVLTI